ncbi:MAG TPA: hypothetical protein VK447_07535, partial [Myxococcaceae bacterium]|nr:hypothetical protein [Myxococcaceae bacterium]
LAFHPTLFSRFGRMQSDIGDTRHLNYVLEHGHRWLVQAPGHPPLWSPAMFFPEPNTGAYTELLLGVVPFYTPWRLLGLLPDTAFQLWMITVAVINFVAAYLLLRRPLGHSPFAASFGAFLFSFGTPRLAQLNHQHLLPQFFTLWALHALLRVFQRHREGRARETAGWILAFSAALAAQVYACFYYGWFFGVALLVAALWTLGSAPLRAELLGLVRARWRALAVAVVGGALALAPLGWHYLRAARTVGVRQFGEAVGMIPRFQSWFDLGAESWLYGWTGRLHMFSSLPMEWEHRLGFGLLTTGLVVWALWRGRRRPLFRLLLLTSATIILLASYYRGGWTPWWLVFHGVPGARAIRAVTRIGILLLIPAAIGFAAFLDRAPQGRKRWVAAALGLFCLVEQGRAAMSYDKAGKRADVDRVSAAIGKECRAFYYSPEGGPPLHYDAQLDAMWAQLETGVPTLNGYSSNFPRNYEDLMDNRILSEEDRARIGAALDDWMKSRGLDRAAVCWVRVPAR